MKSIILISKFSTSELSGHALVDDERYFDFLVSCGANFRLYTSRYSVDRILSKRTDQQRYLRAIQESSIDIESGSRVVFIGFSELDVVNFLAINILRRPRLVLIATNNFSSGRVKRLRWILKLFLRLVSPFLDRLVLHTLYEKRLVAELDRKVAVKSVVKKHHLMTPHHLASQILKTPKVVSFYGPEKHDKPIAPFIDLLRADTERRFVYRIYNVKFTELVDRLPDLPLRINVEVFEGWQSHESYVKSVKDSSLVFLTHSQAFEGKLSGNLCDCIALRVPYIARSMEPMISYQAQYGPLGHLVDFDDQSWTRRLLDSHNCETYANMCRNLERVGEEHSIEAINSDLKAYLIN